MWEIVSAIQLNVFRVRGVELSEIPSSALAASVRKHGRQERRYLATATLPREMQVECNVKRKRGTMRARAYPLGFKSVIPRLFPCSLPCANTFPCGPPAIGNAEISDKHPQRANDRALSALYVVFALQRPFSLCVTVNKSLNVTDHPSDQSWNGVEKLWGRGITVL